MIEDLKIAISEKQIDKARRIMINELIGVNYPHEVFKDAIDLASECGIFEDHDNGRLISNPKAWNKEYLESLKNKLENNFSRERFLTTYYVARKLDEDSKLNVPEEKCPIEVYDEYKDFKKIAKIGAVTLGVTAVGIGILLLKSRKK